MKPEANSFEESFGPKMGRIVFFLMLLCDTLSLAKELFKATSLCPPCP
jgi:hypothetical protein